MSYGAWLTASSGGVDRRHSRPGTPDLEKVVRGVLYPARRPAERLRPSREMPSRARGLRVRKRPETGVRPSLECFAVAALRARTNSEGLGVTVRSPRTHRFVSLGR